MNVALPAQEITETLEDWASGRRTLKEIVGYSDEELYVMSHMGYFFLMQGKNQEARTLFEGLLAIDPKNDYYYRALGIIFHKMGDAERAIKQFGYAIGLNTTSPYAYVNRAEIYISLAQYKKAEEDLRQALTHAERDQRLSRKAYALLQMVMTKL